MISGNSQLQDSMKKQLMMLSGESFTKQESKSKKFGCFLPSSEEQRQPKSESRENTKKRPRPNQSGLSTASFATGTLPAKRSTSTNRTNRMPLSTFWRFCLSLIFAASVSKVTIGSHNLHSFKQSAAYHKACIEKYGGVWFAQELWLSEKQLPTMQQLGTQYVARSGMEQAVSDGILVGRPFGGVSIAWAPNLDHLISPLNDFCHKRIVGVEMKSGNKEILLLSIYMPYFNSSRRAECVAETIDAIAMLDTVIEQHPTHLIVIGGDFNSELKVLIHIDTYWRDFTGKMD